MEQVNATKSLFKFLRKLKVCGIVVVTVEGLNPWEMETPMHRHKWSYSMKMSEYIPGVYRTPVEIAEDALEFAFGNRS